jgi:hypothetical protein
MYERDRDGEHKLGDRGGYIQMDDTYLGGEWNGGRRGRGATGKIPFIDAVETDDQQLGRKCDFVRIDIPSAFAGAAGARLRAGGISTNLKLGVSTNERVANTATFHF